MTEYQFGAMSSLYSLQAENKLTAYCCILSFYNTSPHLVVVYEPVECKEDSWLSFDGKISERLDEIFGGDGSFDKYFSENIEEIKKVYATIKELS